MLHISTLVRQNHMNNKFLLPNEPKFRATQPQGGAFIAKVTLHWHVSPIRTKINEQAYLGQIHKNAKVERNKLGWSSLSVSTLCLKQKRPITHYESLLIQGSHLIHNLRKRGWQTSTMAFLLSHTSAHSQDLFGTAQWHTLYFTENSAQTKLKYNHNITLLVC